MLSIKLIEEILIEQDPEGLIKMGAPDDEYSSEAELIYNRIITENKYTVISYTTAVVFVFYEMFGSSHNPYDDFDINFNKKYLNDEYIASFKIIGKLIFDRAQMEI